ncbi:acireductone synthase [Lichenicola sp.]|uniref:acireductone synthase n=1 Tax=Lichenicola sp. TaxID=2804529 RepID=UPI003B006494
MVAEPHARDRPDIVLVDIEGTTTPVAFVHRVLFPHARAALPALLAQTPHDPEVIEALAALARLAPGRDPLEHLTALMDRDEKLGPLKVLQGVTWRTGYADGRLVGELYPDVAPALRSWHADGVRLAVYSSGSSEAQELLFRHTAVGDLTSLFDGFFDTRVGAKRELWSYAGIAGCLGVGPASMLFLSDIEPELDAAQAAGMQTCQLVRAEDATQAGTRHQVAADFDQVAELFGLPAAGSPA